MDRGTVYPAVGTHSPTRHTFRNGSELRRHRDASFANDDITLEKDVRPARLVVYLAVCLFSLSGSLPTRALWMELPVLTRKVPEGGTLSLYLVIILLSANVAALAYLVARRFARNRLSEVPVIYSCFGLGAISLAVTGCFWSHTTLVLGQPSSFALLLSGFLAAIVSAVSVVTYIPFMARLREPYVTAVFLGDALASLLPHLLTVAQGITTNARCPSKNSEVPMPRTYTKSPLHVQANASLGIADDEQQQLDDGQGQLGSYIVDGFQSTTPAALRHLQLRFSEYGYFLVCGALLLVGVVSFVLIRWCRLCRLEYAEQFIDHMDDVELNPERIADGADYEEDDDDVWQTSCDGLRAENATAGSKRIGRGAPPDDVTLVSKSNSPRITRMNSERTLAPNRQTRGRVLSYQQQQQQLHRARLASSASECTGSLATSDRAGSVMSLPLLIAITFWTTAILSGPLSADKAYACFPVGNTPFLVGTLLCDVAVIVTCVVAAHVANRQQTTIAIALCCLGTVLLTYFVALIAFSQESESREQSPLYGRAGEMLTALAWTAVTVLFSYARVTFGVVCRQTSVSAVHWYTYTTLFGRAVGTISMINNVSVCQVFHGAELTC